MARMCFGDHKDGGILINAPVTHQDIADSTEVGEMSYTQNWWDGNGLSLYFSGWDSATCTATVTASGIV